MNNKKSLRSVLSILVLVLVLVIGVFSLTGCGGECTEHDFDTQKMVHDCAEGGTMTKLCKKCGYYEELPILPGEHTYTDWSVTTEATCRSVGVRSSRCDICNRTANEDIPKVAHTVEEWAINTEPTAETVGRASGRCTVSACNEYVYVDLPVLSETDYDVEIIDTESKNYTLKTGDYDVVVFVSNYYFINLNNESYSIGLKGGCTISAEKLVIPSTYNGKPVTRIRSESFKNQSVIKEVVIPEGVIEIQSGVFDGCTNLVSVTLPSTIKVLGEYKSSLSYNGRAAFTSSITNVYYGGTLEDWCKIRLYGSLNAENLHFADEDGEYSLLTEITIPQEVTAIGDFQFNGIKSLEKVNMHGAVASIGYSAFAYSGIKSFDMPNSVTAIGEEAFRGCASLEEIKLSESLELINRNAFSYCSALKSAVIPANVKTVDVSAFNNCTALSEVSFAAGTSLSKLGDKAFDGCTALTYIILPDTLTAFGRSAINYPCSNIYYTGNANAFASIDGINNLSFWTNTVYYFSAGVPLDTANQYWHYDENDDPVIWVAGNVVSGKVYTYSHTVATVTDEYWMMLKSAEAQGMLEMLFPSSELGEEFAAQQIAMITGSSTKAEYEEKLCAFSATTGENTSFSFADGKLTLTVNGTSIPSVDYVEFDNVIYLTNGTPICYIDAENDRIYEYNVTEYSAAYIYYELVTNG